MTKSIISLLFILLFSCNKRISLYEEKLTQFLKKEKIIAENISDQLIFLLYNHSCSFCVNEITEKLNKTKSNLDNIFIVFIDSKALTQIDKKRLYSLKDKFSFKEYSDIEINELIERSNSKITNHILKKENGLISIIEIENDYNYYFKLIDDYASK